jgi:hypothetical protein
VLDGRPGPKFDAVFFPLFSPDSHHLTYGARRGDKELIVYDHEVGPEYDEIRRSAVVFSDDGRHWVYQARRDNRWRVVIDGWPGPEFDTVILRRPQSGRAVHYLAIKNARLYRVTHRSPE